MSKFILKPEQFNKSSTPKQFGMACKRWAGMPWNSETERFETDDMSAEDKAELFDAARQLSRIITTDKTDTKGNLSKFTMLEVDQIIKGKTKLPSKYKKLLQPIDRPKETKPKALTPKDIKSMSKKERDAQIRLLKSIDV